MIGLLAVAMLGAGISTDQVDRVCNVTAVQLGAISPKPASPPNWYSLAATATTDRQSLDRQINVQAVVTYSYVNADGETTQGQSIVALKGDGAAGNAAVALSGSFSPPSSHGPFTNTNVETSLCLIDM